MRRSNERNYRRTHSLTHSLERSVAGRPVLEFRFLLALPSERAEEERQAQAAQAAQAPLRATLNPLNSRRTAISYTLLLLLLLDCQSVRLLYIVSPSIGMGYYETFAIRGSMDNSLTGSWDHCRPGLWFFKSSSLRVQRSRIRIVFGRSDLNSIRLNFSYLIHLYLIICRCYE